MKAAMARRTGTIVLDSEGLSRAARRDRDMIAWLALATVRRTPVVTTAMTLVEAAGPSANRAALHWALSRVKVQPVTNDLALAATELLIDAGLHGHRHAIDAVVAATAHTIDGPVGLITSDPDDLKRLCGPDVQIVPV